MDSIFAAIFAGPCFKINLFGYDFGFCEVTGWGGSWVEVYLGPFGQTRLDPGEIIFYAIITLLVGFVGLSVGYVVKKTQQNKGLDTDCDIQPVRGTDASPLIVLRQKKKLPVIAKIIFLSAVMLALVILFGPYFLLGIICGLFIVLRQKMKLPDIAKIIFMLVLVILFGPYFLLGIICGLFIALRQKMKLPACDEIIFLSAVMLALVILFGPYFLPGIICGLFIRERFEVVISIGAAGGFFILYQVVNLRWGLNIGLRDETIIRTIISWGVASILFLTGFRMPKYFREGFRTAGVHGNSGNEQNNKVEAAVAISNIDS